MDMEYSRSSARLSPLPLVRVVITVDRCCRVGQGGRWEREGRARSPAAESWLAGRPCRPPARRNFIYCVVLYTARRRDEGLHQQWRVTARRSTLYRSKDQLSRVEL